MNRSQAHAWAYGDSLVKIKGGRGVDLPEILHTIFSSSCFARISPTVLPEFGRAVNCPPAPLPRTPIHGQARYRDEALCSLHKQCLDIFEWITLIRPPLYAFNGSLSKKCIF